MTFRLLDLEIYAWIARYLEGKATLDEFEDWFVPETWQVERSGNIPAIEVATPVRVALAELSAGELDENGFRTLLGSLAAQRTERIRMFHAKLHDASEPLSETVLVTAPAVAE